MERGTSGIDARNRKLTRDEVIGSLTKKIDEVLQPLLPDGSSCALLDFPNHSNVGDSAIWLGEKAYLRRHEVRIVYSCDLRTYSSAWLAKRLGKGTIILHGGGNFGDLWSSHQRFRERVLEDFPSHRVIVMPQTIYFADHESLKRAKRIMDGHPDVTLLVRDQRSLEFARNEFQAQSLLCPDMAFALGALRSAGSPQHDVLTLLREDKESRWRDHAPFLKRSLEPDRVNWLTEPPSAFSRAWWWLIRQMGLHPRKLCWLAEPLSSAFDGLAIRRLRRGCRILSRGRVVITDYLHGHILSLLLGIPHVVLDNSHGKISVFYQTWTKPCELGEWADSLKEAETKAATLSRSLLN